MITGNMLCKKAKRSLTWSVKRNGAALVSSVEGEFDVRVTSADLVEVKRRDVAPVAECRANRHSCPCQSQMKRMVIDAIGQSLLTPVTCGRMCTLLMALFHCVLKCTTSVEVPSVPTLKHDM